MTEHMHVPKGPTRGAVAKSALRIFLPLVGMGLILAAVVAERSISAHRTVLEGREADVADLLPNPSPASFQ